MAFELRHSRISFGQAVRRAIRAGVLTSYERDHWMGRTAVLADGTVLTYEPRVVAPVCDGCGNGTVCLVQQHTPGGGWLCVPCLNRYDGPVEPDWRAECRQIDAEQAGRGR